MRIDSSRYVPLGLEYRDECKWIGGSLVVAAMLSLVFPFRYCQARSYLFEELAGKRILKAGAMMPDFSQLLSGALQPCLILAACMLALIPYHYYYHFQASKSIYLMRRLPSRWELWRRCLSVPLLAAASFLVLAGLLTVLYYGVYLLFTPDACLTTGQWAKLWTFR